MGILQNETRIEPFIDSVFSFLHRKTDFYRTLTEESQVGFPAGVAENMLRCYFMKYNMKTKEAENIQKTAPKVENVQKVEKPKVEKIPAPIPEKPKTQDEWQENSESHNGAVRDTYSWNQNFEDVDVTIPTKVTNSKSVRNFGPKLENCNCKKNFFEKFVIFFINWTSTPEIPKNVIHVYGPPLSRNVQICEHSIFFQLLNKNMFNETLKIRLFIDISWRF